MDLGRPRTYYVHIHILIYHMFPPPDAMDILYTRYHSMCSPDPNHEHCYFRIGPMLFVWRLKSPKSRLIIIDTLTLCVPLPLIHGQKFMTLHSVVHSHFSRDGPRASHTSPTTTESDVMLLVYSVRSIVHQLLFLNKIRVTQDDPKNCLFEPDNLRGELQQYRIWGGYIDKLNLSERLFWLRP